MAECTSATQASPVQNQPRLAIRIANGSTHRFTAAEFDDSMIAGIMELANTTPGTIHMVIVEPWKWADPNRWCLLRLLHQCGDRCDIQFGGQHFSDPFLAVLAMMAGPNDLRAHDRSIRGAIEAAALFHPGAPEASAQQINHRLEQLGAPKIRLTTLTARIRRLAEPCMETPPTDALDAARGYLHGLRQKLELPDDELPLRFYQGIFYEYGEIRWRAMSDDFLVASVTGFLQSRETAKLGSTLVKDVIANLRGLAVVPGDWSRPMPFYIFDESEEEAASGPLLVFTNGMIRLGELLAGAGTTLMPHDPRWFTTTVLSYDYDPEASCPGWLTFLGQVLPPVNAADQRQQVFRAFVGYCLLSHCAFERMLILIGTGSNGKSVALKTVAKLLGEENVENVPYSELTKEFRLASLIGKSANITMELNHLGKSDESLLRSIISGEQITVNRKFLSPIKTKLFAKLLVGANELPTFTDATDATWRRLLIIPFRAAFPECASNRQLADQLAAELPGIFNWAAQGLRDLVSLNGFPHCEQCELALTQHRTESNTVREFLDQCCSQVPGYEPQSQAVYDVYHYWCARRQRKPVAENEFGRRMKLLGYQKDRGSVQPDGRRPYVYLDLHLRPDADWVVTGYIRAERPGWQHFPYAATPTCPGTSG